ncbi:YhgE/Pip domain-containing protein [Salinibacterium sp. dk2585]|uniref:YhgE/Pip domain-containing protein n=1 Tax=unclassified Salinibacterium TaxID=2632331 RepID=UPI0011C24BDD|nr:MULTISPECIES: YhgE/Pip domain-containing protein [unclassified Salinibacterium]QEE61678.1 YhgE/Pip domain-containing protein [Salinibacterium sp. dk2585]TXK54770.1 YhgE/Pip domain-containing protein [Salinibacterium sp. dk5596]
MKIPAMIAAEFRRLVRKPMAFLALLALGIVPLLYGGMYLWANQNPYGRLAEIPVALVVEDEGVDSGGTETNYGDQIAVRILDAGTFDWHRVSAEEADRGVRAEDFDFVVTIPSDFSESVASSETDAPRKAEVLLTTNDANSYLGTTIGQQAVKTVRDEIVQEINKEAAARFLGGLATIRTSLVTATEGVDELLEGTQTAARGADELAAGTTQLAVGSVSLRGGLNELLAATSSLPAQSEQLATGAGEVAAGNERLSALGGEVAAVSRDVVTRLDPTRNEIERRLQSSGLTPEQIAEVLTVLDELGTAVRTGDARVQDAATQLGTLAAGSVEVAAGARQLADAAPSLVGGIRSAANGSTELASGAEQVNAGATQLSAGLPQVVSGVRTLQSGLAEGVERIPESTSQQRSAQAANIADPVTVKTSAVAEAGTYGAGLAPFFVGLAAWIGIYALFLIVKPVSQRAVTALHSPVKITIAGWLTPTLIGALQMVGLFIIVAVVLGFRVENPWGAYGLMALSSATFAAIILALNIWLSSVGQFIGLVMMVLQLVTAGGTFPWQTLPPPLAFIHHLLPMSYTVDGLRQLMYGGDMGEAVLDALVISAWLLVAFAVAALGVTRMTRVRTLADLEPSLIG